LPAERLRIPPLPEAPTPMMPALADDSTASMKRRRLSITSLALTSSSRWLRNSCVILLKVSPSWAKLRGRGGIEQASHVKECVVERPQPDHRRDVVLREYRNLRLGFVDVAEEFCGRRGEVRLSVGFRLPPDLCIC